MKTSTMGNSINQVNWVPSLHMTYRVASLSFLFCLSTAASFVCAQALPQSWQHRAQPPSSTSSTSARAQHSFASPTFEIPPGSTTRVLPDGRVAVITPFTEEQKRQIAQREARQLRIRAERQRQLSQQGRNDSLYPRLPGEFEKQKAILLSSCDWQPHNFGVLVDLIKKSRGHANLIILFNDKSYYDGTPQLTKLVESLAQSGRDFPHIRFLNLNLDTIWLRDFGPRLAETESGGAMAMDFFYDTIRPFDDDFPKLWADMTNASHNEVPWTLQGGNLLSNGRGLAIATSRLFEDNRINRPGKNFDEDEVYVREQVMKFCNIKGLAIVKPLEHENTRHIDMFATFLAPDFVVVAQLDPRYDPQNAAILNDNARQLAGISLGGKPLRVERVLIPPRRDEHWSTYTNIILTDRLALIPTLKTDPPGYAQAALARYRRWLPNHHVESIDMTSMDKLGGSLHCLSCPIPEFAELPEGLLSFRDAVSLTGLSGNGRVQKPESGRDQTTADWLPVGQISQ